MENVKKEKGVRRTEQELMESDERIINEKDQWNEGLGSEKEDTSRKNEKYEEKRRNNEGRRQTEGEKKGNRG